MRLELDARARSLLRRFPRTNVYSLAELLLLAVLAVQCARLLWAIVTPVGPLGDWRPAQPGIAGSPGAILRDFDPFFRSATGGPARPAIVTSLQLVLFGTRLDEANGGGSAIIAGPDGVQQSISVGKQIMPGVVLKAVAFDHVTVDRGGVSEDLFIDQSGGVTPVDGAAAPGTAPSVPLPGVPTAIGVGGGAGAPAGITAAQLRSDIGFIPRIDHGRVSGLVVRAQGSGAAFREAGFRDGDIVTAIGGRPVTGQGDMEKLAAQFAGGGNLSVTVERGANTLPLVITIASQ